MTAFGTGEYQNDHGSYRCEIKTLNSRFLDQNIRLPRKLVALEHEVIDQVKGHLQRGKVDVFFDIKPKTATSSLPSLNVEAVEHYVKTVGGLRDRVKQGLGQESIAPIDLLGMLNLDGILESTETTTESFADIHREGALQAAKKALEGVLQLRAREGEKLQEALREILGSLESDRQGIQKQSDEILREMKSQVESRLEAILSQYGEASQRVRESIPEERILAEIAVLSDKADIAEELVRLDVHTQEFLKALGSKDPVGRKLDFLCQEMHREVNTISSKMNHLKVSKNTLKLKQAIERLRQQVQNIE